MKKLKMGTPAMGIAIGLGLVGAAVLVMLIGFWKTLLLLALFGIGYFLGTVENKQEFIKDTANKIIPEKEAKVIDLKSEIAREQEEHEVREAHEVPEIQPAEENKYGE
jgi:uncharacterized membrane protein